MNTPEERREEQIEAIAGEFGEVTPALALDRLLEYFELTEQRAVADAIRYGAIPQRAGLEGYFMVAHPEDHRPDEDLIPDESDIADLRHDEARALAKDEG